MANFNTYRGSNPNIVGTRIVDDAEDVSLINEQRFRDDMSEFERQMQEYREGNGPEPRDPRRFVHQIQNSDLLNALKNGEEYFAVIEGEERGIKILNQIDHYHVLVEYVVNGTKRSTAVFVEDIFTKRRRGKAIKFSTQAPKLKVGDYVEVSDRFTGASRQPFSVNEMRKFKGKITKIHKITTRGYYILEIDGGEYLWTDDWVRGVTEEEFKNKNLANILAPILTEFARANERELQSIESSLAGARKEFYRLEKSRDMILEKRNKSMAEIKSQKTQELFDSLEAIKKDPRATAVDITEDGKVVIKTTRLFVKTSNIRIEDIDEDLKALGEFTIEVNLKDGGVYVRRKGGSPCGGKAHPHVSGHVCWGNMGQKISKALKIWDIYQIWIITIELLESYSSANPFIRLEQWHNRRRQCLGKDDVIDPICESCEREIQLRELQSNKGKCPNCGRNLIHLAFYLEPEERRRLMGKDKNKNNDDSDGDGQQLEDDDAEDLFEEEDPPRMYTGSFNPN